MGFGSAVPLGLFGGRAALADLCGMSAMTGGAHPDQAAVSVDARVVGVIEVGGIAAVMYLDAAVGCISRRWPTGRSGTWRGCVVAGAQGAAVRLYGVRVSMPCVRTVASSGGPS